MWSSLEMKWVCFTVLIQKELMDSATIYIEFLTIRKKLKLLLLSQLRNSRSSAMWEALAHQTDLLRQKE